MKSVRSRSLLHIDKAENNKLPPRTPESPKPDHPDHPESFCENLPQFLKFKGTSRVSLHGFWSHVCIRSSKLRESHV